MKLSTIFGLACALALFTTVSAHAATLASYPFTGSSLASTDTDAASTAGGIALGSGLTDTTRFAVANGNPAPALRINTDETSGASFAAAVTNGDFFSFSLTPNAGEAIELNALTFDLAVNSALFTSNVRVELSANGTTYTPAGSVTAFSATTFTAESVDLSPANAALAAGLPIYVRFVVFDSASNANAYTAFDNITVDGVVTAAIPEPGTNALLALGALGAVGGLVLRRRQATV